MDLIIQPLTPQLAGDYFDFFENRAFTDDSPYRCYCQIYQMTKSEQQAILSHADVSDFGKISRNVAKQQIDSGALRGYLAFVDGRAIGWCNANDKANFPIDSCGGSHFHSNIPNREIAVVCFEVAPNFRGQGVATALLNRVISDAKANQYMAVESFPVIREERYEWDCTGPVRLYEKAGFVIMEKRDDFVIMRKEI
ncbi:MAG: GNAT family N-acetyltransferase [Clostridiales bacterium]|nr:GNAT family N-acetyltransferase [Clostridiales bacterium]